MFKSLRACKTIGKNMRSERAHTSICIMPINSFVNSQTVEAYYTSNWTVWKKNLNLNNESVL